MQQSKVLFKGWALFGISLLAFTAFLDVTIVNTALPFIQTALKTNILQLQWVVNIFTLILSMTMIVIGKGADRWGRKKVFYVGVFLFALGALGAGASNSIQILILFRGIQALGASTVFISSASLLSDLYEEHERVRAISFYGGVTGFGLMIGPFIGGVLIALLSWRWVFWINLPLIALGLGICFFTVRSLPEKRHYVKIDLIGLTLLIFGLGALMLGIIEGAHANWTSLLAWILLVTGILALIALLIYDDHCKNPLLDFHIFKKKLIVLAALSISLAGVVSTVFLFFDSLYLRMIRQLSPLLIGLLIATIPAAQALIAFVFNRSVKKFGVAHLLFVSICAAFLGIALHRLIDVNTPLLFLLLPFFLLGVNWGLTNAGMLTAINQVISSRQIGAALGTLSTIWNIVGSIILAISSAIFHIVEKHSSFLPAFHRVISFNILFAALVLACAIGVLTKLKREKR